MGILTRVAQGDFSRRALKMIPPVVGGEEYWNFFGNTQRLTTRNLIRGKPDASILGSIGIKDYSMTTVGGSGLQTLVPESANMTLFVVAKMVKSDSYLLGNASGPSQRDASKISRGLNFYTYGGSAQAVAGLNYSMGEYTGTGAASQIKGNSLGGSPVDSYQFLGLTISEPTGRVIAKNFTNGNNNYADRTAGAARDLGANFRVGCFYDNSYYAGATEILAAGIYSRALTDTELNTIYQFCKQYYADRGITI